MNIGSRQPSRSIRRLAALGGLVFLVAAWPESARAQQPYAQRWSISVHGGPNRGGPVPDMTAERRRQAWDDPPPPPLEDPLVGAGDTEHVTREGDGGWALAARYRHARFFGAGLFTSRDWLGHSSGYRQGPTPDAPLPQGASIHLSPVVWTTALLGGFHVPPPSDRLMVRLEAGPALYRARALDEDDAVSRYGALVGIGVGLSLRRFQLSLEAQRRFVGDLKYGPYTRTQNDGEVERFEEASASFDHDALFFGVGYAF